MEYLAYVRRLQGSLEGIQTIKDKLCRSSYKHVLLKEKNKNQKVEVTEKQISAKDSITTRTVQHENWIDAAFPRNNLNRSSMTICQGVTCSAQQADLRVFWRLLTFGYFSISLQELEQKPISSSQVVKLW